jgi:hypothetical protein
MEPDETKKRNFFMQPIGLRAECYEVLLIGGSYEFEEATTGACSRTPLNEPKRIESSEREFFDTRGRLRMRQGLWFRALRWF